MEFLIPDGISKNPDLSGKPQQCSRTIIPYKCVMYQIISIKQQSDKNGVLQGHVITPFLSKI